MLVRANLTMSIYSSVLVENLSPGVNRNVLFELFRHFGRIVSIQMLHPAEGQVAGYIQFESVRSAVAAQKGMNGKRIGEAPCVVSLEPHTIVIDNIPDGMQVDDLANLYSNYGDILDAGIEVAVERNIRFCRGYVAFLGIVAAKNAILHTNGRSIRGHPLTISMAPEGFVIPHVSSPRNGASGRGVSLPSESATEPVTNPVTKPVTETESSRHSGQSLRSPAQRSVFPAGMARPPARVPETCASVMVQGQEGLDARTLAQLLRPCGRVREIDQVPEGFQVLTDGSGTVSRVLDYCGAPVTDGQGRQWWLVARAMGGQERGGGGEARGRGVARRANPGGWKDNRGQVRNDENRGNVESRGNYRGRGRGDGVRGRRGKLDRDVVIRMPGVSSWKERDGGESSRNSRNPSQPQSEPSPRDGRVQGAGLNGRQPNNAKKSQSRGNPFPPYQPSQPYQPTQFNQFNQPTQFNQFNQPTQFNQFNQPTQFNQGFTGYSPFTPAYPNSQSLPPLQESEAGLLVEDLDPSLGEAAVRGIFRTFGPIQRVQFVDPGVAAVYFARAGDAVTAKKVMDGREIEGVPIHIARLVRDGGEATEAAEKPATLDDLAAQAGKEYRKKYINSLIGVDQAPTPMQCMPGVTPAMQTPTPMQCMPGVTPAMQTQCMPGTTQTMQAQYMPGSAPAMQTPPARSYPRPVASMPVTEEQSTVFEVRRGAIKATAQPVAEAVENTQPACQQTPTDEQPRESEAKEVGEVVEKLQEVMDMLGPIEEESLQGLSEEEKNEYLKEFLLPIITSVDEENAAVIAEELLKVDESSIVSAINDANVMYDAIASTREQLGL